MTNISTATERSIPLGGAVFVGPTDVEKVIVCPTGMAGTTFLIGSGTYGTSGWRGGYLDRGAGDCLLPHDTCPVSQGKGGIEKDGGWKT